MPLSGGRPNSYGLHVNQMLMAFSRTAKGANHALIIGINNYDSFPGLQTPVKDAETIANILIEKYNFKKKNVVLLTDKTKKKPTLVAISDYFEKYLIAPGKSRLTEKDNLLIFFSGHSREDARRGETYWIPRDAHKRVKGTWLSHSELCNTFFLSPECKVKNLCILTDSVFSKKLTRFRPIVIGPRDPGYERKIRQRSRKKSREIISFDDPHWEVGSEKRNGLGLFAYFVHQALVKFRYNIIDLENLLFELGKKEIKDVSRIAGTKLLRGRLKKTDEKGQFVIIKKPSPPVHIRETKVSPKAVLLGSTFVIEALSTGPAKRVFIEIEGLKKRLMKGRETKWIFSMAAANVGRIKYRIRAMNFDRVFGKPKAGEFRIRPKAADRADVIMVSSLPEEGAPGEKFRFTVVTDKPAASVLLKMDGIDYKMNGSGTNWFVDKAVKKTGAIKYSAVALNEDGERGEFKQSVIRVKTPLINVVEVSPTPKTGYAGDDFTFTAITDRPAAGVSLRMDGVSFAMSGVKNRWTFTKKIPDIGKRRFAVIAKNSEGAAGISKSGQITTRRRPLLVPDVAMVTVSPKKVYKGDMFAITATTSARAEKVYVEINRKRHSMEGADTHWNYMARLNRIGIQSFRVIAQNKDGKKGGAKKASILIVKKPFRIIDVVTAEASPGKAYQGRQFLFKATTSASARSVNITINNKSYAMAGSGAKWSFKKKMTDIGIHTYSVVAKNKEGMEGSARTGTFTVKAVLANVVQVESSPKTGRPGDEFTITAVTDRPATSVSLQLGGMLYPMQGKGNRWTFKQIIPDIGKKQFTVIARNFEDEEGRSGSGEIITRKKVIPIPSVASVDIGPDKIYTGDYFTVKVSTDNPSDEVYVVIDGERKPMDGFGTKWNYSATIDKLGKNTIRIHAKNSRGQEGKSWEGSITTLKKSAPPVNVILADVTPDKGEAGETDFTFKAMTDISAAGVFLILDKKRYPMKRSEKEWVLSKKLNKIGKISFSAIAINEDRKEGDIKTAFVRVEKAKERYLVYKNNTGRVINKGTGKVRDRFVLKKETVTDLLTGLMWFQEPKTIAVKWEEAVEFCRSTKHKGFAGWRLPTVEEWREIIDKSRENPSLPPGHPFKKVLTHMGYWSKSKHRLGSKYVYMTSLWNGKTGYQKKVRNALVWPVRYTETP